MNEVIAKGAFLTPTIYVTVYMWLYMFIHARRPHQVSSIPQIDAFAYTALSGDGNFCMQYLGSRVESFGC